MPNLSKDIVAAVVVSYFPEEIVLLKLLNALMPQVDKLILVDNGGAADISRNAALGNCNFVYVNLGNNLGLGHALNIGFEHAVGLGAKYVATFDQDSAPSPDLIANLLSMHRRFLKEEISCAAVAPVFFDRRETVKTYFPFYFEKLGRIESATPISCSTDVVETDVLITSGMLVRADVWSGGVHYDEGLFVDYTDTEWCFRARSLGYKLYGCLTVEMGHAPSDAPPARFLGFSFFRYSPLRRYYYFRNTVKFLLAPYVSGAWRRRLSIGLMLRFFVNLLIDEKKFVSLKMMMRGVMDGFRGISGEIRS